jgi:hypothetical protein
MQLLTVFVDLLLQTKGKHEDIRPLLVQTMVALLKPLLKYSTALPSGVDYTKWFQVRVHFRLFCLLALEKNC